MAGALKSKTDKTLEQNGSHLGGNKQEQRNYHQPHKGSQSITKKISTGSGGEVGSRHGTNNFILNSGLNKKGGEVRNEKTASHE